jgi:hypothetical protein
MVALFFKPRISSSKFIGRSSHSIPQSSPTYSKYPTRPQNQLSKAAQSLFSRILQRTSNIYSLSSTATGEFFDVAIVRALCASPKTWPFLGCSEYASSDEPPQFPVLAVMIRLGRKYEIAQLKEDALGLLKKAFPVTLDDHSEYVWEAYLAFPEDPVYDHDGKKLAAVLRLAYECNIRTILPLVVLQFLTLDLVSGDLFYQSLPHDPAIPPRLPSSVRQMVSPSHSTRSVGACTVATSCSRRGPRRFLGGCAMLAPIGGARVMQSAILPRGSLWDISGTLRWGPWQARFILGMDSEKI